MSYLMRDDHIPLQFRGDEKDTHPFIEYLYPAEVNLLSIEGANGIYHVSGPNKTSESFNNKEELDTYLDDLSSGTSSHDEDFTISEHSLAIGDWDIFAACRLTSSRLTRRKRSLLKRLALYMIDQADDDDTALLKQTKRLEIVHRYCRNILRRRSAKAYKRFRAVRKEMFPDVSKEAEVLRKREFADKELNRADCSETDEPNIFNKLLAARRQAVILKYQKYTKSLPFRRQFQQRIYYNVNMSVPDDDSHFMLDADDLKTTSNTDVYVRTNKLQPENNLRNTASEGHFVIDLNTQANESVLPASRTSDLIEAKNLELRRVIDSSDIPMAHQMVQIRVADDKIDITAQKPKRRSRQKYQLPPKRIRPTTYSNSRSRTKSRDFDPSHTKGIPQVSSHLKMVSIEGTPYFTLISEKDDDKDSPLLSRKQLLPTVSYEKKVSLPSVGTYPTIQSDVCSCSGDDEQEFETNEGRNTYKYLKTAASSKLIRQPNALYMKKTKIEKDNFNFEDAKKDLLKTNRNTRNNNQFIEHPSKQAKSLSLNRNKDDEFKIDEPESDQPKKNSLMRDFDNAIKEKLVNTSNDYPFLSGKSQLKTNDYIEEEIPKNQADLVTYLKKSENPDQQLMFPPQTLAVIPACTFETNQSQVWKLPEVVVIARKKSMGQTRASQKPIVIEAIKLDEYSEDATRLEEPFYDNGIEHMLYDDKHIVDLNENYIVNQKQPENLEKSTNNYRPNTNTEQQRMNIRHHMNNSDNYEYIDNQREIKNAKFDQFANTFLDQSVGSVSHMVQNNTNPYDYTTSMDSQYGFDYFDKPSNPHKRSKQIQCELYPDQNDFYSDYTNQKEETNRLYNKTLFEGDKRDYHHLRNTNNSNVVSPMVEILRIPNTVPDCKSRNRVINSIRKHENADIDTYPPYRIGSSGDCDPLVRPAARSTLAKQQPVSTSHQFTSVHESPLSEIEERTNEDEAEEVDISPIKRRSKMSRNPQKRRTSDDHPDMNAKRNNKSTTSFVDRSSIIDVKNYSTFKCGGGIVQLVRHTYINRDLD